MRIRRWYVGLGLSVTLALVALTLVIWSRSGFEFAGATEGPAGMSLTASGNVSCDSASNPTKCTAVFDETSPKNGEFQLTVETDIKVEIAGFGAEVYFSGLTYNPRDFCSDEVVMPNTQIPNCFTGPEDQRRYGATTAVIGPFPPANPGPTNVTLVEIDVHCSGTGTFKVGLTAFTGTETGSQFGAKYKDSPDGNDVLVAVVGQEDFGNGPVDIADTLDINCGGEALPTPTHTLTPTHTPTPANTPPPNPCQVLSGECVASMSLSASGGGIQTCEGPTAKPTKCTAAFLPGFEKAAEFQLIVNAVVAPQGGYAGFGTEVIGLCDLATFDTCPPNTLIYNPRATCDEEVILDDLGDTFDKPPVTPPATPLPLNIPLCVRTIGSQGAEVQHGPGQVQHGPAFGIQLPFDGTNYTGPLVELDVHCPAAGQYELLLTAFQDRTAIGEVDGLRIVKPQNFSGSKYVDLSGLPVNLNPVTTRHLDLDEDPVLPRDQELDPVLLEDLSVFPPDRQPGTELADYDIADVLIINCETKPTPTPQPCPAATGCLMSLQASGPGIQRCDGTSSATKCTASFFSDNASASPEFTLTVNAAAIPAIGYGGFDAEVFFGGLTYNGASCLSEVAWEDVFSCDAEVVGTGSQPRQRQISARSALFTPFQATSRTGALVELAVQCPSAGQFQVVLTADSITNTNAPLGSVYLTESGALLFVTPLAFALLDTDGSATTAPVSVPAADALLINCVDAGPTPSGPSMFLGTTGNVDCDGDTTTDATPVAKPTKCTVPFVDGGDNAFQLTVNANTIPDDGYGGFRTEVFFGGLDYTPDACSDEVVWQDEFSCFDILDSDSDAQQHEAKSSTLPLHPASTLFGALVELDVACPSVGQFQVALTARPNTAFRAKYIDLDGGDIFLDAIGQLGVDTDDDSTTLPVLVPVAAALLVNCGGPAATPTATEGPSPTPAGTSTPTLTPTPCPPEGCPTPTPTPVAEVLPTILAPPPEVSVGDANCDGFVNSIDAFFILVFGAGLTRQLPCGDVADVNGDIVINSVDALLILQFDALLVQQLPVGVAAGGWAQALRLPFEHFVLE